MKIRREFEKQAEKKEKEEDEDVKTASQSSSPRSRQEDQVSYSSSSSKILPGILAYKVREESSQSSSSTENSSTNSNMKPGSTKEFTYQRGEGGGFPGEKGVSPSPSTEISLHEIVKCAVAEARITYGRGKDDQRPGVVRLCTNHSVTPHQHRKVLDSGLLEVPGDNRVKQE